LLLRFLETNGRGRSELVNVKYPPLKRQVACPTKNESIGPTAVFRLHNHLSLVSVSFRLVLLTTDRSANFEAFRAVKIEVEAFGMNTDFSISNSS
jgi:hypothetical protein